MPNRYYPAVRSSAAVILIGTTFLSFCSRDTPGWTYSDVPGSIGTALEGGRLIRPLPVLDTLVETRQFALPSDSNGFYRFAFPTTLAVSANGGCQVAVGDLVDRAVHVFSLNGDYKYSFFGGGRSDVTFGGSGLSSIAPAPDGRFLVATLAGRVLRFDEQGKAVHVSELALPADTPGVRTHQIIQGPDGLLYDHWFAGEENVIRAAQWDRDSSLIRVFDASGRLVRRIGTVVRYPGVGLTHYLNRGEFRIADDTLWFARRADARILAFPLRGPYDHPSRVIDLPLYFQAALPVEYVSRDEHRVAVRSQDHLQGFSIGPDSLFYVIQDVSWPPIDQKASPYISKSIIDVVGRDGIVRRSLTTTKHLVTALSTQAGLMGVFGRNRQLVLDLFRESSSGDHSSLTTGCGSTA